MIDLNKSIQSNYLNEALKFYDDCRNRNLTIDTSSQYKSFSYDYLRLTRPPITPNAGYLDFKPSLLEFQDYLKSKNLNYQTVKVAFTALNNLFSFYMDEGLVTVNPVPQFRARYVRTYKKPDTPTVQQLQPEDIEKLIDAANAPIWETAIAIYALCGLRREELLQLNFDNIDLDNQIFYINPHPKRTNLRVPYSDDVAYYLHRYLKYRLPLSKTITDKTPVFLNEFTPSRLDDERIRVNIQKIGIKAGLHNPKKDAPQHERLYPKTFRHFFTTQLRLNKCPDDVVAELRGDRRDQSQDNYYKMPLSVLKKEYLDHVPHLSKLKNKPKQLKLNDF